MTSAESLTDTTGSPAAAQPGQQFREVSRRRGFELHHAAFTRMQEAQLPCVQRLSSERDRTQGVGTEHVPAFANKRVSAQPCLDANLVAAAGSEANLDQ